MPALGCALWACLCSADYHPGAPYRVREGPEGAYARRGAGGHRRCPAGTYAGERPAAYERPISVRTIDRWIKTPANRVNSARPNLSAIAANNRFSCGSLSANLRFWRHPRVVPLLPDFWLVVIFLRQIFFIKHCMSWYRTNMCYKHHISCYNQLRCCESQQIWCL